MRNKLPIIDKGRYRSAFMQLAERSRFTHWLTLNTHRECSLATASKYLKRWRIELLRRLHGQKFYLANDSQLTWYMGCPELSAAGHPHFHLALVVPDHSVAKFELLASCRWKAIVQSGTSHLVPIGLGVENQRAVLSYAAKWLDARSELPFVHSKVDR